MVNWRFIKNKLYSKGKGPYRFIKLEGLSKKYFRCFVVTVLYILHAKIYNLPWKQLRVVLI